MKTLCLAAAVLVACQAPPEAPEPAKALDPGDPRSVVEHAAFRTKAQKSYEAAWTARLQAANSNPLDYKGICVHAKPGLLYSHYTASGGDDKKIVRIGSAVAWIHDLLAGWVPADEAGYPAAGRGFQNPDDVLTVLAKSPGEAKLLAPGAVELTFTGTDIEKVMREQSQQGAFDWKRSKAVLRLATDAEGRLKKLDCSASLVSTDPNVKGEVSYLGTLEVTAYNGKTDLEFKDEKGRVIPLKKKMLDAIEQLRKEKP
jgi:hypothetical protein